MGMWTEDQFASRAKDLAKAHVGSQTPINDLVEKVAREAELTPDAIRTLGRFTNVAVFQEMFSQKAASAATDRMVEFEPGDPEIVIQRVVKSADIQAAAAQEQGAKVAAELPDLMRGVRGYAVDLEKEASYEEVSDRTAPKALETMRLRKMAQELEVTAQIAAQRWDAGMAKLATAFKRAPGYGPSYEAFEKAALSEWGSAGKVELATLREDLRLPSVQVSAEKIAKLQEHSTHTDTPELTLLGEVIKHREQYEILKIAQEQVAVRLAKG